jgi:hypothetical protein
LGIPDQAGPHDRLDDFRDIHCGNKNSPAFLNYRKAEDIFDIVDVNLARIRFAFDGFCRAAQREGGCR